MTAARRDDRGASSVEYGLIVVLIAAVIVTALVAFGDVTTTLFDQSCEDVTAVTATGEECG